MNYLAFFGKRLLWMLLTLWAVFTVTFFLMRAVPGGPFDGERKLEPEIEKNVKERYRLNQPLPIQYADQLWHAVQFDLGPCYRLGDFTVNEVIAQGFPISASLGIVALSFALMLGLTTGIVSAVKRGSLVDVSLRSVATVGIALPNFVIASMAIILFVFQWQIFPAAGWGKVSQLFLPGMCLGAPYAAYIARLTRTSMLDVLGQDYIRTARAKGLDTAHVIFKHAIKGALLPVVSFLGPATAGILTGSLVIEKVFAIPGLGVHFINAATQRDYTLAMGLVLLYTLLLSSANMLVDLSYSFLDPRVKME